MVKLTTLPDDFCQERIPSLISSHGANFMPTFQDIGFKASDNHGFGLVVNIRKELCGAFVNTINVTLVNYTKSGQTEGGREMFRSGGRSEKESTR